MSAAESLDAFGGTLLATGLFTWLGWLYGTAQETSRAYRTRVTTRRRA